MENVILTSVPDEPTAAAWNDCLDNAEFAGLYTAPEYFLIQYFANERPFAVLVVSSGVVHGVATGLLGNRDINCGHSGSPQICIRRGADMEKVGMALAAGIRSHSLKLIRFISAFTWDKVSLSRGADASFSDCTEARRRNIRRAIKAGVEVAEMDIGRDFDEYYAPNQHWCAFKHCAARPSDVQRAVFATGSCSWHATVAGRSGSRRSASVDPVSSSTPSSSNQTESE